MERGAVDGHKGLVPPGALIVDALGKKLLSGAGRTGDQHIQVGAGILFGQLNDTAELGAAAQNIGERMLGLISVGV